MSSNKKIKELIKKSETFIAKSNITLGTTGAVIGLSGGIDSTICATLCARVLGPSHCLGVIMPAPDSNPKDEEDGIEVGKQLHIPYITFPLLPVLNHFITPKINYETQIKSIIMLGLPVSRDLDASCIMKMRARMYVLSYYASINNYFQCQTLQKTEWLMGWFDPFADALGDVAPLLHLYKSELYEMATHLRVPEFVIKREPGPGTWPILDREIMYGLDFEELDLILRYIELDSDRITTYYKTKFRKEVDISIIENIRNVVYSTEDRRTLPLHLQEE